jgi:hypothetical protein
MAAAGRDFKASNTCFANYFKAGAMTAGAMTWLMMA